MPKIVQIFSIHCYDYDISYTKNAANNIAKMLF